MNAPREPRLALMARLGLEDHEVPAALWTQALTHRSFSADHYERLEFLGDAVLGLAISARLVTLWPQWDEGRLTRTRAELVREGSLHQAALRLGVDQALRLSEGEARDGGAQRPSILADALEAIFGAVFIAQGFERAAQCVVRVFDTALREGQVLENRKDPKTSLQEWLQARRWPTPIYTIVATTGLAHAQTFEVRVEVPGFAGQALGRGPTRRAAEQAAAADLLPRLAADPAFQGVKPRPKEKPLR